MFLHIGVLHLLFNMVALWNVGGFMEHLLAHTGFLVLYLLAGLLGSVASVAWNPFVVSAGASGAIFGLYGGLLAFLVRHRAMQQHASLVALRTNTLAFLGYNLVFGFIIQGIDMAAHLGGLVGGFVCGFVLTPSLTFTSRSQRQKRNVLGSTFLGLGLIIGLSDLLPRAEDVEAQTAAICLPGYYHPGDVQPRHYAIAAGQAQRGGDGTDCGAGSATTMAGVAPSLALAHHAVQTPRAAEAAGGNACRVHDGTPGGMETAARRAAAA